MIPRVWTYWDGPRSPWIDLCLQTIARNIPDVEILTPETWRAIYTGPVARSVLDAQRPNVVSDYIRAWLLHEHGGIWIDADAIVFRDVRPIWGLLRRSDFVAYRVFNPRQICSALIAGTPRSRIGAEYLAEMHRRLDAKGPLRRLALGPNVLKLAWQRTGAKLHLLPQRLVHPIPWGVKSRLWGPRDATPIDGRAYCCMLTHRALGPLASCIADDLLSRDTVVSHCFRVALGVT